VVQEADPDLFQDLKRNIATVEGISSLRFEPNVTRIVVSKSIAPKLERKGIPTLMYADPCGYKGLSLRLITASLKRFGNDCAFFFNYRRVNMKLGYPVMDESIRIRDQEGIEDRLKQKLVVELKWGPIKDEHVGQIMYYQGALLSGSEPVRTMLVGTRVPPAIQKSLDFNGLSSKEIRLSSLIEFLRSKGEGHRLPP
jgi:hypothetical protein